METNMNQKFNTGEDFQARATHSVALASNNTTANKRRERGMNPIWQGRLALMIMINIAQLWILQGTIEAALAREYKQLLPLVIASGVCFAIALSIFLWWRPASRRYTSTGYLRGK
jgi:hypothetical protein